MRLLAQTFATDAGTIQFSLSVFFFGQAIGQVFYGPLIARFGCKGPLLAGRGLYAGTSLLPIVAPTAESFIGLQFLQAIGGSASMTVNRAIIADLLQAEKADRTMSLLILIQTLAPILAPVVRSYTAHAGASRPVAFAPELLSEAPR